MASSEPQNQRRTITSKLCALAMVMLLVGSAACLGKDDASSKPATSPATHRAPATREAARKAVETGTHPVAPDGDTSVEKAESYPHVNLKSDVLAARVYLPDAKRGYNIAKRFDKSGMIARVETKDGHTFFAPLGKKHDPKGSDAVIGTAEEFDMDHPPGYDESKPGEPFIKIGVGILKRKSDKKYWFPTDYDFVKPGEWKVTPSEDGRSITFVQQLEGPRDWAYVYTKTVSLAEDKPVITIARTLRNTGKKTITTTHYGHNFVVIDDKPAGPGYEVHYSFKGKPGEKFKSQGHAEFEDGKLIFKQNVPSNKPLWGIVEGHGDAENTTATILHRKAGAAVDITTDRPLTKMVMYAKAPYVAAEPFVTITVEPGKEQSWTTTYRFRTDVKKQGNTD